MSIRDRRIKLPEVGHKTDEDAPSVAKGFWDELDDILAANPQKATELQNNVIFKHLLEFVIASREQDFQDLKTVGVSLEQTNFLRGKISQKEFLLIFADLLQK